MNAPGRIFLVGLPGAGKTTVGKQLAEWLGYRFNDLDAVIEQHTGRTIADIFQNDGEDKFREMERDHLRHFTNERQVLATGGGTPCFHTNMNWMNQHGCTVFLDVPLETIEQRIGHQTHRPLISSHPLKALQELLEKRREYYHQAQVRLQGTDFEAMKQELEIRWS